jgi:tetratricopeptide (TPR) repeat protein
VLYALGKEDQARKRLDQASMQWRDQPVLGVHRAHLAAASGDYPQAHALAQRVHRGPGVPVALRAEAVFDAVRGRLAEAREHLRELRTQQLKYGLDAAAIEVAIAIGRLRLIANDAEGAVREVETVLLRNPLDSLEAERRPYLPLALFYAQAGRPQRARELLADYQRLVPLQYKRPDAWMVHRTRAALLLAADSPAVALAELREAETVDPIWEEWFDQPLIRMHERPELARTFERLGMADSAIAVYERYLRARALYRTEMDAFHLAHALQRLGALHEERNQPTVAACYYNWFVNLWGEADPELRPLAEAARQRVDRLRANARGRLRWSESSTEVQARRCSGLRESPK